MARIGSKLSVALIASALSATACDSVWLNVTLPAKTNMAKFGIVVVTTNAPTQLVTAKGFDPANGFELRLEGQDRDEVQAHLLLYEVRPNNLDPGAINVVPATDSSAVPLPAPDETLRLRYAEEPLVWQSVQLDTSTLPIRVREADSCPYVEASNRPVETERRAGLVTTAIAISASKVLMAGEKGLLGVFDFDEGSYARIEVNTTLAMNSAVWSPDVESIYATYNTTLVRADAATSEIIATSTVPIDSKLIRSEGGQLYLVHAADIEALTPDLDRLPLNTAPPAAISGVVLLGNDTFAVRTEDHLYLLRDGVWTEEEQTFCGTTSQLKCSEVKFTARDGQLAMFAEDRVGIRDRDGRWTDLPNAVSPLLRAGAFTGSGSLIVAGSSPIASMWIGSKWCKYDVGTTRSTHSIGVAADDQAVFHGTYGSDSTEPNITRALFP